MPEEEKGANEAPQELGLASPPEQQTQAVAPPQEEAKSSPQPKEENTPFHEHPRFRELISEKNQLKEQLSNMERVLQEKFESPKQTVSDIAKQKLVSLGLEDKAAQELLEAVKLVSSGYTDQRLQPIEQAHNQLETDAWIDSFSKEHKDFESLQPQMTQVFQALPKNTQYTIASDPMGLQLLYSHVKMQNMEKELKSSYQSGVEAGYKNKQSKSSITPSPAGSKAPPGEITRKGIREMTPEKYAQLKKELGINAIMEKLQAEGEQSGVL